MKKLILLFFIIFSSLLFSQNDSLKFEIELQNSYKTCNNSSFVIDFLFIGAKIKYFSNFEIFSSGIEFSYLIDYFETDYSKRSYSAQHVFIPLSYSIFFFKKWAFNPCIGISINNNFIFNEEVTIGYSVPVYHGSEVIYETNKTKFRYQTGFEINAGFSTTIKKQYTINFTVFYDLINNYELNPKGEDKLPYHLPGVNVGFGYKS